MKQLIKSTLQKFWTLQSLTNLSRIYSQIGKPFRNYILYKRKVTLRKQKNRAKKAYLWYSKVSLIISRIGFSSHLTHIELLDSAELCVLHFQKQFPDYTEEITVLEELLYNKRIHIKSLNQSIT